MPMKIRILSDLHIEINGEPNLPDIACDAVVLAGDTGTKLSGLKWALKRFPDVPVLYLYGNHEFYGDYFQHVQRRALELTQGTQITILEKSHRTLGGFDFFGATLWSDLALNQDPELAALDLQSGMNDYKKIRYETANGTFPKLRPAHTSLEHARTLRALDAFLAGRDPARCVVLTHHAPSTRTMTPEERKHACAPAYASNLEDLVKASGVRLWVHGHIHASANYTLGRTQVVANPLGYDNDPRANTAFNPNLIVDLGAVPPDGNDTHIPPTP